MSELGKLFANVSRYHGATVHQAVSKLKVGRGMPPVLGYISTHDGCRQSDISRLGHVSPATATVMLQSMEKNGFIIRRSDETDQRCMRVYITDKGKEIARLGKVTVEKVDEVFFSVLSNEERRALGEILKKLQKNIEKEWGREKTE